MEYYQVLRPESHGICSWNDCPCSPDAILHPGEGYLYIPTEVVAFRKDARSLEDAKIKCSRVVTKLGVTMVFDPLLTTGVLVCEIGARKLGLDLEVASADAKYWWKTGDAPLRPTPKGGVTTKEEISEGEVYAMACGFWTQLTITGKIKVSPDTASGTTALFKTLALKHGLSAKQVEDIAVDAPFRKGMTPEKMQAVISLAWILAEKWSGASSSESSPKQAVPSKPWWKVW